MKKLSKILSLVLAMAMLLSVVAMAEGVGSGLDNSKAKILNCGNGAVVTFADASTPEKISVTYEKTGLSGQYLIMMVTATKNGDKYTMNTPGSETIKYIDQVTAADNKITFEVYPSQLTTSIIMIYGIIPDEKGEDSGERSLEAAIVEAKYTLGDINGDKKINISDVIQILQHIVGTRVLSGNELQAANVTRDLDSNGAAKVNISDAIKILQYIVNIVTEF